MIKNKIKKLKKKIWTQQFHNIPKFVYPVTLFIFAITFSSLFYLFTIFKILLGTSNKQMQISQCSTKSYPHSIFLALKILIIDSSMDLEIFPKHIPCFGSASFSFVCTCKCEASKPNQSST